MRQELVAAQEVRQPSGGEAVQVEDGVAEPLALLHEDVALVVI